MALVLKDRVRETSTTTGTGSFTLGGTSTGFQSFSVIGDGNTTYYGIVNSAAGEWEVGVGTYTASGTVLSRDTILESSNGGSAVDFSAGTKDVFVTYPAERSASTDTFASPPAIGSTTPAAGTFTTLTATGQTSLGGAATAPSFRATVGDNAPNTMWVEAKGASSSDSAVYLGVGGTPSKPLIIANSANSISFRTTIIGGTANQQLNVAHTASAVNYVQVTGAATTGAPSIVATGSDTNVTLLFSSRGTGDIQFRTNSSSQVQFQVLHTASAVNRSTVTGAAAGSAPVFGVAGSDTNISQVFQSKGTGAIDLAAGSSGVNISNGGTVTAITRTAAGSGYTSPPVLAITAPTTADGVQATATAFLEITSSVSVIASGGTGYTVNDVITVSGGSFSTAAAYRVTSVSGGVITGLTITQYGSYSSVPSNPASVTGGTGSGATLTLAYQLKSSFTITNAGSGYVEQPTVSFSGGGGSGAAAYATVGGTAKITGIGAQTDLYTPSGAILSTLDGGLAGTGAYLQLTNSSASNSINRVIGSGTNLGVYWLTKGTGPHAFATANSVSTVQFNIAHTASAVNYVQVTGAATGSSPAISAQGSDTNIPLALDSKGSSSVFLRAGGLTAFATLRTASSVNYLTARGSIASSPVELGAAGSDTNIDLTLTPKGTGNVRFGTLTASADAAITGYITIKDSGGTVRKLAVIA